MDCFLSEGVILLSFDKGEGDDVGLLFRGQSVHTANIHDLCYYIMSVSSHLKSRSYCNVAMPSSHFPQSQLLCGYLHFLFYSDLCASHLKPFQDESRRKLLCAMSLK